MPGDVLYTKLAYIQQNLKAPKSQFNAFGKYNYRSCEDILEAVKPLLGEATLTIADDVLLMGNRYYVRATATLQCEGIYMSVQAFAREEDDKKGMDASQITGAASSYARKYALNGLFLIDDTKDADTRDNTKEEKNPVSQPPQSEAPKQEPSVEAKKHDGKDQKQMQVAIGAMLQEMYGDEAANELFRMTSFTKNDKVIEGKRNPYELATKPNPSGETRTGVTYTKVRDEYKKWKEALDGDNPIQE
jgi:hypothetical protein